MKRKLSNLEPKTKQQAQICQDNVYRMINLSVEYVASGDVSVGGLFLIKF